MKNLLLALTRPGRRRTTGAKTWGTGITTNLDQIIHFYNNIYLQCALPSMQCSEALNYPMLTWYVGYSSCYIRLGVIYLLTVFVFTFVHFCISLVNIFFSVLRQAWIKLHWGWFVIKFWFGVFYKQKYCCFYCPLLACCGGSLDGYSQQSLLKTGFHIFHAFPFEE